MLKISFVKICSFLDMMFMTDRLELSISVVKRACQKKNLISQPNHML